MAEPPNLDEFVRWAQEIMAKRVRQCDLRDTQPDAASSFVSINIDESAYRAALLMRRHDCTWLGVHEPGQLPRFVELDALGDARSLADAAPYLGEETMKLILEPAMERQYADA
jgi:hypothetical protein